MKGACPVWSGGKAERPNLSLPEREQEGRGESLHVAFEVGCNSPPSVNERNASSPRKRLVLNAVKREENRVPSDSNGDIPGSRHLGVGDEHTPELSLSRTSERWSIGWVQKDQAWGWAAQYLTQVQPPRNPAESVTLRMRKTSVRNARNSCCLSPEQVPTAWQQG